MERKVEVCHDEVTDKLCTPSKEFKRVANGIIVYN